MPYKRSNETVDCEQCGRAFHPIKQNIERRRFCSNKCTQSHRASQTRLPENFWANVEKTDYCWIWKGGLDGNGYGQLSYGGRAHHHAWLLVRGHVAPKRLKNVCQNRRCIRPEKGHWE